MLVLSSPSGAGKTTISRALIARNEGLVMSVSATTRPARPGEAPGREYHFVSEAAFRTMLAGDELLEHAAIFGHLYGTPRRPVEEALAAGRDVLFDIDWQGAQQLKDAARDDLVSVFILPPSTAELERRLLSRAQDSETVVRERIAKAADELSHYREYDYIVVNDDLENAVSRVQAILTAERLRLERQLGLHEFVTRLRAGRTGRG